MKDKGQNCDGGDGHVFVYGDFSPGAHKALESDSHGDRDSELVWGCCWSLNF